jgi:hypothetical protein
MNYGKLIGLHVLFGDLFAYSALAAEHIASPASVHIMAKV